MATLPQIRGRILTQYQSLTTQREKLEFLYQVQERLKAVHNARGAQLRAGTITQEQWDNFKPQWLNVSEKVSERIAVLREKVFTEDYALTVPSSIKDEANSTLWSRKKQELKDAVSYKNSIDTIWQ